MNIKRFTPTLFARVDGSYSLHVFACSCQLQQG